MNKKEKEKSNYKYYFGVSMKFLLIIIIMLTSTIFASEFDLDTSKLNKEESTVKNDKKPIDIQEINDITNNIINNVINFQNMLPKITGEIVSLPKAGTIGIKFDKDKISITKIIL